ncbi:hypothetical protein FB451DRAFT_1191894 [Mycena latifolia]|nr:hypothetical protein FB451DRAFT_1191894 [Mycena latifolia]
MAWEILRSRIVLGRSFLLKYEREFNNPRSIEAYSPASTTVELSDGLLSLDTPDLKLRHMLAYYPHHNGGLRDHHDHLHIMSDDWLTIVQRGREEELGNREDMEREDLLARESSSQAEDGQEDWDDTVQAGKQKEVELVRPEDNTLNTEWDQTTVKTPPLKFPEAPSHLSKATWQSTPVELGRAQVSGIMGAATPYKSAKGFFTSLIAQNAPLVPLTSVAEENVEPNILKRVAAGPLGTVGDRYTAAFGQGSSQISSLSTPAADKFGKGSPLAPHPSNPFESSRFPVFSTPAGNSTPQATAPVERESHQMKSGTYTETEEDLLLNLLVILQDRPLLGTEEEARVVEAVPEVEQEAQGEEDSGGPAGAEALEAERYPQLAEVFPALQDHKDQQALKARPDLEEIQVLLVLLEGGDQTTHFLTLEMDVEKFQGTWTQPGSQS